MPRVPLNLTKAQGTLALTIALQPQLAYACSWGSRWSPMWSPMLVAPQPGISEIPLPIRIRIPSSGGWRGRLKMRRAQFKQQPARLVRGRYSLPALPPWQLARPPRPNRAL